MPDIRDMPIRNAQVTRTGASEDETWVRNTWTGEGWTGQPDNVAAIALVACLFVAGLVFLVLAAGELHP
ncbi:MAG TPA: hypothetical protein VG942_19185 [Hyphomonadaceae bacterium]|nr:hypothetical protein [Hyphomonadaceae bacterium]